MKKEAKFWKQLENKKVQCLLCPHKCKVNDKRRGVCGVRENIDGKLYTLIYGSYSSIAVDPIEKKPLYHFYPGSNALSFGTIGCNLRCLHCQNYTISRVLPEEAFLREVTPDEVVELAKNYDCEGVAWTYNEPAIWHEFTYDASKEIKKEGLYTVYVSNGYINEDPFREIAKYLDAINIDVKAFHEEFYKKICSARLEPVLETCVLAKELGIHLEITYLVIPTYNDSLDEIRSFCRWVLDNLGDKVPLHFSRFHPDYKMVDVPPTSVETLINAYNLAKEQGIKYVYLGNVPHGEYENTYCPSCGELLIERYIFTAKIVSPIKNGKCPKCGTTILIKI
jgi:pyruvate formate lyase activating enzyme